MWEQVLASYILPADDISGVITAPCRNKKSEVDAVAIQSFIQGSESRSGVGGRPWSPIKRALYSRRNRDGL